VFDDAHTSLVDEYASVLVIDCGSIAQSDHASVRVDIALLELGRDLRIQCDTRFAGPG
jgi:hypothetical protein